MRGRCFAFLHRSSTTSGWSKVTTHANSTRAFESENACQHILNQEKQLYRKSNV